MRGEESISEKHHVFVCPRDLASERRNNFCVKRLERILQFRKRMTQKN